MSKKMKLCLYVTREDLKRGLNEGCRTIILDSKRYVVVMGERVLDCYGDAENDREVVILRVTDNYFRSLEKFVYENPKYLSEREYVFDWDGELLSVYRYVYDTTYEEGKIAWGVGLHTKDLDTTTIVDDMAVNEVISTDEIPSHDSILKLSERDLKCLIDSLTTNGEGSVLRDRLVSALGYDPIETHKHKPVK